MWLGLGANEGDRRANLKAALSGLTGFSAIDAISPVYETEPVGYADQPPFWNLVVRVRTKLAPRALLLELKHIEVELGRRDGVRWGPRPIDIDILLYGDLRVNEPALQVPHARMLERGFVLRPLADLDPDLMHPVTGQNIADVLRAGGFEAGRRLFDGTELAAAAERPERRE